MENKHVDTILKVIVKELNKLFKFSILSKSDYLLKLINNSSQSL